MGDGLRPVPEPKTVKNRLHWDVRGDVDELIAAGARLLRARDEEISWDVLADPEGNEFCVFDPRGADQAGGTASGYPVLRSGTTKLRSVAVSPSSIAAFALRRTALLVVAVAVSTALAWSPRARRPRPPRTPAWCARSTR